MAFGVAAYLLWGLLPLYWPLLAPATAVEILAHRIVWSLLVVLAILAIQRDWHWLSGIGGRRLALLGLAAVIISLNWATYIHGVTSGQVVETSLGYFINPLVTVMLGVVVLRETLRPAQWAAIALAAVAVTVLTVDYGRPPWIALVLACSFAGYGFLKKRAGVGAVHSLTVETAVLLLPALAFLLALSVRGSGTIGEAGSGHAVLLAGAGVVTAAPLLCFGAAAIRVPLTTIGLLQYLAPVMQFVLGVLVFREAMPLSRWLGFVLVWAALVVLTADALRSVRRRQLAAAAEAVA
ncbi:MAG: EamA family transporter RarD [Euzebyales bacterium]|nr:EamA family transporter RarD [Euzebyales bacterium]